MTVHQDVASINLSYEVSPWLVGSFFKMLADEALLYPSGLPDKALQRVFDRHQAVITDHLLDQQGRVAGHRVVCSQKSA